MTLVEMLTAMMVGVILIGTAFSTFWAATQAWEKSKRRSEMIRLLDGTADVITRYLRTIQPPFIENTSAFLAIDDGDDQGDYDSVAFISSANPKSPRQLALSDICEVQFYIDVGQNSENFGAPTVELTGDLVANSPEATPTPLQQPATSEEPQGGLWMRIDATPDDDLMSGGYRIQLAEQINSLNFRFFDGTEWLYEWYDDTQVPQAVEFTLIIRDPLERENPMVLIRLVDIPMAKAINDGTLSGTASSTSSDTSSGSGTSSGSTTPSGSSSSGGTSGGR
jgi:uncharacterized membrane protein YgcG